MPQPFNHDPLGVEIPLATAKGARIPNGQITEISTSERNEFRRYEDKYGSIFRIRTFATARYNCHGLSFASRRTGVYEESDLQMILDHDGYKEVERTRALPGDLIAYFDEKGEIEHTGFILTSPMDDLLGIPDVCSKWGKYHELIHPANSCPYSYGNVRYFRIQL